ncbi:hypothetical protein ACFL10_02275 [Patescibacteria group bacterium]
MYGSIEKVTSFSLSFFRGFGLAALTALVSLCEVELPLVAMALGFLGPAFIATTFFGLTVLGLVFALGFTLALTIFGLTLAFNCFLVGFLTAFFFEVVFLGIIKLSDEIYLEQGCLPQRIRKLSELIKIESDLTSAFILFIFALKSSEF